MFRCLYWCIGLVQFVSASAVLSWAVRRVGWKPTVSGYSFCSEGCFGAELRSSNYGGWYNIGSLGLLRICDSRMDV